MFLLKLLKKKLHIGSFMFAFSSSLLSIVFCILYSADGEQTERLVMVKAVV